MSGEAGGLILIPMALAAVPVVIGVLAVGAVAAGAVAAGNSAVRYEQEQRRKRDEIRKSGVANRIGDFRSSILNSMNEQSRLNIQASEQMLRDLSTQRGTMERIAAQHDPQAYQEYLTTLKTSHVQTMQGIARTQETFNANYRQKIVESMGTVSQKINEQYAMYMDDLQKLQSDLAAKEQRAREIADAYLEEARTLLASLADDYEGRKFTQRQLSTLNEQLNQAISQYNSQHYETAIASAKDVAINTLEEIFEADALRQEWENYQKLALVLSEEVKTFIEAQEFISAETKAQAEAASGKQLEDEIVGIRVADYTDKNAKGQTRYDYLLYKTKEVYAALRGQDADDLTTDQLKTYVEFLNNELYPAIASCINKGIINMNNAFSRQNISEEIIDFFEEHNFTFCGYAYEDDCHDKALHIGVENQATGEELIITLAPELLSTGDIQTHVDLKQTKGDEANEERKAYYRECISNVVKSGNPYAKVDIKCNAATRGKLSADTETRKKLKQ